MVHSATVASGFPWGSYPMFPWESDEMHREITGTTTHRKGGVSQDIMAICCCRENNRNRVGKFLDCNVLLTAEGRLIEKI